MNNAPKVGYDCTIKGPKYKEFMTCSKTMPQYDIYHTFLML